MTREEKREQDELMLMKLERNLRAQRVRYTRNVELHSTGGRRMRAYALGECCLRAREELEKLSYEHTLIAGTVHWIIDEQHVVDPDGKKGYKAVIAFLVDANEQKLTEEEIAAEVAETRKRVEAETEEMFADEQEEQEEQKDDSVRGLSGAVGRFTGYAESDLLPVRGDEGQGADAGGKRADQVDPDQLPSTEACRE